MEKQEKKKFSIITERNKNAVTIPITGAWGGPSPDGSALIAHFYIEYKTPPYNITFELDDQGRGDPDAGHVVSRGDGTREVQVTAMMTPEHAISIGQWLVDKGSVMLQLRKDRESSK